MIGFFKFFFLIWDPFLNDAEFWILINQKNILVLLHRLNLLFNHEFEYSPATWLDELAIFKITLI